MDEQLIKDVENFLANGGDSNNSLLVESRRYPNDADFSVRQVYEDFVSSDLPIISIEPTYVKSFTEDVATAIALACGKFKDEDEIVFADGIEEFDIETPLGRAAIARQWIEMRANGSKIGHFDIFDGEYLVSVDCEYAFGSLTGYLVLIEKGTMNENDDYIEDEIVVMDGSARMLEWKNIRLFCGENIPHQSCSLSNKRGIEQAIESIIPGFSKYGGLKQAEYV